MALGSYYITYAGQKCTDFGIYPVNRPSIPTGAKRATAVQIPGHDGDVYIEDGAVNDIKIPITFDFRAASPRDWGAGFRQLKRWLDSGAPNNTTDKIWGLSFSDDLSFFYAAKRVEIGTTERTAKTIGRATVTFICEGWAYLLSGMSAHTSPSFTITNPTSYPARPVISLISAAGCTMSLSYNSGTAKTFTILAGAAQRIVIDTRRRIVSYTTGESALSRTSGDIDDFEIPGGATLSFSLSSGSTTSFTYSPFWREL